MFFLDPLYLVIVGPAMLIAMLCQMWVKSAFEKWSRVRSRTGLTGADAAERVLRAAGIYDVSIESVGGFLSDHYDPRSKTLRLSPEVYSRPSIASVAVAAHECGHAMQQATQYPALALRSGLVPAAAVSNMAPMLFFMGFWFHAKPLMEFAIIAFSIAVAFTLVTLPVEINASMRAVRVLGDTAILDGEELRGARQMLTAAAMTYVAAAVAALSQLLYYVLLMQRRD